MAEPRDTAASALPEDGTGRKVSAGGSFGSRTAASGHFATARGARVQAVMDAAQRSGLLQEKSGRIGGRVSPALVEQAKARTGIDADTELIEFALANIALDDRFAESFKAARGKVNPDLKLGY